MGALATRPTPPGGIAEADTSRRNALHLEGWLQSGWGRPTNLKDAARIGKSEGARRRFTGAIQALVMAAERVQAVRGPIQAEEFELVTGGGILGGDPGANC